MGDRDRWHDVTKPGSERDDRTVRIPIQAERASLIALTGPLAGRRFTIDDRTLIGRSEQADIKIPIDEVSREHAAIQRTAGGQFVIEDLKSRNATHVNGVPIEVRVLQFGDKIQIGSRIVFVFAHYSDVEEQLERWQRMELIGQMAAGVVHDFNNCLTIVLGNIQYMQAAVDRGKLDEEALRRGLREMEHAARQGANMAAKVLSFARGPQVTATVDFTATIEEGLRLVHRGLGRAIKVETNVARDLPITADHTQLLQVVVNLVLNARDAMPQGGTLTISAQQLSLDAQQSAAIGVEPGSYAELRVKDDGIGMDERTRMRIFEPLFTTKAPGKGTGLGLATVQRIIEAHDGVITVESEPGRGTTFAIYLPTATSRRVERLPTKSYPAV